MISLSCPKISNPEEIVEIAHEDLGDRLLYDVSGHAYAGYASRVKFKDKVIYCFVNKDEALYSGDAASFRMKEEIKQLRDYDIDLIAGMKKKWPNSPVFPNEKISA